MLMKTCSSDQHVSEQKAVGAKTEVPTRSHSTAAVALKVAHQTTTPACLSRNKVCVNNSRSKMCVNNSSLSRSKVSVNNSSTCSPTLSLWNCQISLQKHRVLLQKQ